MPASVPKLMTSPEAGALVLRFLEQYFLLYDSASRQGLLDAYHENAVMSLSANGEHIFFSLHHMGRYLGTYQ